MEIKSINLHLTIEADVNTLAQALKRSPEMVESLWDDGCLVELIEQIPTGDFLEKMAETGSCVDEACIVVGNGLKD